MYFILTRRHSTRNSIYQVIVSAAGDVPIVDEYGPDKSIIGTEKIAISDLLSLRSLKREEWLDYLINNIDYLKLTEASVREMLQGAGSGFVHARKAVAARLMDAPNFVEFQRRYMPSPFYRPAAHSGVDRGGAGARSDSIVSLSDQRHLQNRLFHSVRDAEFVRSLQISGERNSRKIHAEELHASQENWISIAKPPIFWPVWASVGNCRDCYRKAVPVC